LQALEDVWRRCGTCGLTAAITGSLFHKYVYMLVLHAAPFACAPLCVPVGH
jgi:hypothetical protein